MGARLSGKRREAGRGRQAAKAASAAGTGARGSPGSAPGPSRDPAWDATAWHRALLHHRETGDILDHVLQALLELSASPLGFVVAPGAPAPVVVRARRRGRGDPGALPSSPTVEAAVRVRAPRYVDGEDPCLAIPVGEAPSGERWTALLFGGEKPRTLAPLSDVAASGSHALARAAERERLRSENRRLSGLYGLALAAGTAQDLPALLAAALDVLLVETGSTRGFIAMRGGDDEDGDASSLVVGRAAGGQGLLDPLPPDPDWRRGLVSGAQGRDVPGFPARIPLCPDGPTGRRVGTLFLDRPLPDAAERRGTVDLLGSQLASTIERFRLREAQAERHRMQEELRQAEKVQALLLPRRTPDLVGLAFDVEYHLSRGLGGDYYDFIDMEGDQVALAVADVLGHSVSSAIVMSTCRALLREYCRHDVSPARILQQANDTLERNLPDDMFVTLFLAILDLRDLHVTYANAGQCYPLHFRARERDFQVLAVGGLPLGFQRGVTYREAGVELSADDILVLYTDGVTERRVAGGRPLGVKGLTEVVRRVMHGEAPRLARAIEAAIVEEAEEADVSRTDDVTLITLRVGRDVEREALAVPSTEAGVRSAVERCERFARRRGFISDRILQFRLVLTEALTNAYEHGNQRDPSRFIHLVLTSDRRRMSIRIRDDGVGFDVERMVEQAQDPDLTSSRGRGLTIVRKYVESLQATEKGNAMTLTFSRSTF